MSPTAASALGPYKCEISGSGPIDCGSEAAQCTAGFASQKTCGDYVKAASFNGCTIMSQCKDDLGPPIPPTTGQNDANKFMFTFTGTLGPINGNPYCTITSCERARAICAENDNCQPVTACSGILTTERCNNVASPTVAPSSTYVPPASYDITARITNPLGTSDFRDLLNTLVRSLSLLLVPLLVLAIIYSGFIFVTASSNEEKLKKAKKNALYATIGILIILAANVLVDVALSLVDIFN